MAEVPKYSLLEIERRWLVDLDKVDLAAAPYREIEDLYIAGSRLRLRKISGAEGDFVPPAFVTREITNEPAFTGISLASREE